MTKKSIKHHYISRIEELKNVFFYRKGSSRPIKQQTETDSKPYMPLRNGFSSAFDSTQALGIFEKYKTHDRSSKDCIGWGSHFRSFKYTGYGDFALVISISHPEHLKENSPDLQKWKNSIETISKIKCPLIPPIKLLKTTDHQSAYVTPYGTDRPMGTKRSKDLTIEKEMCKNYLLKQGYIIDDIWQIRWFKDIPFIIDFSDLKPIKDQ